MSAINIRLINILKKDLKLSDEKAHEFIEAIHHEISNDLKQHTSEFKSLWKDDFHILDKRILESKNDMYKAMFISSLVQLIAILGGVLAIVKFALDK